MSFAVVPHEAWYVPCDERSTPEYAGLLRPLFEDETIAKIGQNIKFDLMVLRRIGLAVRGPKYDTMILHYLLDPESRHNMNALAAKYLNYKPIDTVTGDERRKAKTANFGIIYGISAFGLSQRLDIPRKEAKEIIEGYFASYPKVKEYMEHVVERAREVGYVTTIFGRRRYLNDIASRNAVARGLAERNAVNAPIQGSAADIMKIAMVHIAEAFRREGIRSQMILQVHDEVVIDTLRSELDRVREIVTEAMERAAHLKVKLIAECGVGENWLDAH